MLIEDLRKEYHRGICSEILGLRGGTSKGYTNADSSSKMSIAIADALAQQIGAPFCLHPPTAQRAGSEFGKRTCEFLSKSFPLLAHLRPGKWKFSTSQAKLGIAAFEQYAHLSKLSRLASAHPEIRDILGQDYFITPDITVAREPVDDSEINQHQMLVEPGAGLATLTPFRSANQKLAFLHASISCKWTIRSDRAQNTRTEALNLVRNRKGTTPRIIVVTAEPLPARITSIALGTGDVDCTYHFALRELRAALSSHSRFDYPAEEVETLVTSQRLRDISDLPFDLAA
ncbi:NgoMIV family type II restriction endonuclease [Longimicrobium terrae]|uniref:Restriction endonuclease n=1 Tax=Longimicrobium terrae TaxID=1639882 RepID=A0A841GXK2_9BACT|nr:NgoMIV family type II restriction endonuclease [Longimicrobium terrae]MBB4636085.1 hypothetical protein [Longimicrobium terrae]MBB6070480.1 hypothetical protein [Longimicrobium terrae]NNC29471.1 restriction endonuclease [Longimicrobium terrae]